MARFYLLGYPRLEHSSGREVAIQSRKGIALLAMLATSDRVERSRVWLQQMLWGSRPQKQAQSSLRRELANLKKALGAAGLDILQCGQRVIILQTEGLWVDLDHLADLGPSTTDFLEGVDIAGEEDFEDWLREMRSRLVDLREGQLQKPNATPASGPARPPGLQSTIVALPTSDLTRSSIGRERADELTQRLIDLLPRLRWLPIIPAGIVSTEPDDPRTSLRISETLRARYVLQTEVFARGPQLAVNFAMLEMPAQIIRWSETRPLPPGIDGEAMQREVARAVNSIGEAFDLSEQRHAFGRADNDGDLAQIAWKIRFHINQFTRTDFDSATYLIETALSEHPSHSELLMLRANLALWRSWIDRAGPEQSSRISPLVRAAMRADPTDARGPLFSGIIDTWHRRSDRAIQHLLQACALDPSSAQAASHLGAAHYLSGDPEGALGALEHALFLSPLDPKRFHTTGQLATVLWMLGRYDEALDKAREIQITHPGYVLAHVIEVSSLLELGQTAAAKRVRDKVVAEKAATYRAVLDWMPFVDPAWNQRLLRALAIGGPIAAEADRAVLRGR